jgi:uncharacterized protein (TIGR02996 family)
MDATGLGLLRAVLEVPGCDDRRLVYADWLEEQGDGGHAEFVRVQVAIARICGGNRDGRPEPDADRLPELTRREGELMYGVWELGWLDPIPRECLSDSLLRRGFVETLAIPRAAFMEHAHALFARHPITTVTLTDARPMRLYPTSTFPESYLWCPVWKSLIRDDSLPERIPSALFESHPPLNDSFPSESDALTALSLAAANYGRSLHHLPPLT